MEDHPYLISKEASSLEKIFTKKIIVQPNTIKFSIYFSNILFVILAFIFVENWVPSANIDTSKGAVLENGDPFGRWADLLLSPMPP